MSNKVVEVYSISRVLISNPILLKYIRNASDVRFDKVLYINMTSSNFYATYRTDVIKPMIYKTINDGCCVLTIVIECIDTIVHINLDDTPYIDIHDNSMQY
jgi:hypothetical protein